MITDGKKEQIHNALEKDGYDSSEIRELIEYHSQCTGRNCIIVIRNPSEDCDPREIEFEEDYTEDEFSELCRCYDENEMVDYSTYDMETLKYIDSSSTFYNEENAIITAKEMADFYEN